MRQHILLDGIWTFYPQKGDARQLAVPEAWDFLDDSLTDTHHGAYEREFDVPAGSESLVLQFDAVNMEAVVLINGQMVGRHQGGWIPFAFDITDYVTVPSSGNRLRVEVSPLDESWPNGFYGHEQNHGIVRSVRLIICPSICVEDVFVHTSVRQQEISFETTVRNGDDVPHALGIRFNVRDAQGNLYIFDSATQNVPAGESACIRLSHGWNDAQLWSPQFPYLYALSASLLSDGVVADQTQDIRFGFREFWIEGDRFLLNGLPINLREDSIVFHGTIRMKEPATLLGPIQDYDGKYLRNFDTPEKVRTAIRRMLELNFNCIRFHLGPPAQWVLDICDEEGMLVVGESPIYWRHYTPKHSVAYIENGLKLIEPWIKRDRNHACIILWSSDNEEDARDCYNDAERARWAAQVRQFDQSRPVYAEYAVQGDLDGEADVWNAHYFEGCGSDWPDDNDAYAYLQRHSSHIQNKPKSYGEFLYQDLPVKGMNLEQMLRAQLVMIRAARTNGFAAIRPYRLDWAWADVEPDWRPLVNELQRAYAPVAVFCVSMDRQGVQSSKLEVRSGQMVELNIAVCNDGTDAAPITVRWAVEHMGTAVAQGHMHLEIPISRCEQRTISFRVPNMRDSAELVLSLAALQQGANVFSDNSGRLSVS